MSYYKKERLNESGNSYTRHGPSKVNLNWQNLLTNLEQSEHVPAEKEGARSPLPDRQAPPPTVAARCREKNEGEIGEAGERSEWQPAPAIGTTRLSPSLARGPGEEGSEPLRSWR